MDERTRKKIEDILNTFDAKRQAVKESAERRKTTHEQFLEKFAEKCRSVVRPAMEEIGEALKARGHDYEIEEAVETFEAPNRPRNAYMKLMIFFEGRAVANTADVPSLTLTAYHDDRVHLHTSTMMPGRGGASGPAGEFDLEEITAQFISDKLLGILEHTLGG